jgi:site-specific DNA-methyltransferase (adenine-specific)
MKTMPDKSVDCVVTDPPYFAPATHYQSRISWGRCWGDMSLLGQVFFDWCQEWKRIIKDDGHLFVFCNDESYPVFYPVVYGWWDTVVSLVWDKTRVGLGSIFRHQHEWIMWARNKKSYRLSDGHLHSDILSYPAELSRNREHPIEKPPALIKELLKICTPKEAIILDSFMGSGTTGVACMQLGRRFIGCEIDPGYFEIARKRIEAAAAQMLLPLAPVPQ